MVRRKHSQAEQSVGREDDRLSVYVYVTRARRVFPLRDYFFVRSLTAKIFNADVLEGVSV